MTCAVCPNCGFDLERFEPVRLGDLELEPHEIRWKGNVVQLRPCGKLLVRAIARADGKPVSLAAPSEALGCTEETDDPDGLIRSHISISRRAFRDIDPSFVAIRTVWGAGLRWAA